MQDRQSLSINSSDTSISHSKQLESAIPPSKISALSSGEFGGMVADDPDNKIELKTFHCEIINDHKALKKEQDNYKEIPVLRKLDNSMIHRNYLQIKQDVQDIVQSESAIGPCSDKEELLSDVYKFRELKRKFQSYL